MTRVIVCGGRAENTLSQDMARVLVAGMANLYQHDGRPLIIVHGNAQGVDRAAGGCALALGLEVEPHPADWPYHGKAAGPIRNQEMLDTGVDLVLAVKAGFDWRMQRGGTEDMVRRAVKARVPTFVMQDALGAVPS